MYISEEKLNEEVKKEDIKEYLEEIIYEDRRSIAGKYKGAFYLFDKVKENYINTKGESGNYIDFLGIPDRLTENKGYAITKQGARLYNINELACDFYHGQIGKCSYAEERKIKPETVEELRLGYADGRGLKNFLESRGIKKLTGCGLFYQDGSEKFKERFIFPIFNVNGRITGFGGRTLKEDQVKYLNTQTTAVFNKGSVLYGIHKAKEYNELILVEGYMDMISLYQAGFKNVTASMGTALTKEQADIIAALFKRVYLSQDSDGAGILAKIKTADMLNKRGVEVMIVDTTPYKDPDELITTLSAEAYKRKLKKAIPYKRFILENPVGTTYLDKNNYLVKRIIEFYQEEK